MSEVQKAALNSLLPRMFLIEASGEDTEKVVRCQVGVSLLGDPGVQDRLEANQVLQMKSFSLVGHEVMSYLG